MLRVLPPMFKPVYNLICCKMWVVERATSLFNSFCRNVVKQVARFSVPLRSDDGNENVIKAIGLISKTTTSFARASHLFVHFFAVTARP